MNTKFCVCTLTHDSHDRANYLKQTITTFMNSTNFSEKIDWYILSNGINDELLSVFEWAKKTYSNDVNWNIDINEINVGVGAGINQLHTKALHYEYIFFLEGDWVSLPPHVSGHSNNWLHNSVKL